MLAKIEGGRRKGRQMMRWLDGSSNSVDLSVSKLQGAVNNNTGACLLQSMKSQKVGHDFMTEQQQRQSVAPARNPF